MISPSFRHGLSKPLYFAFASTALLLGSAKAASSYEVLSHYPIDGDGGYDYLRVDSTARRLYVAHEKKFDVLDVDTGKKLGEIAPVTRAHGVAIATTAGHGFATSGIDDVIIMFDLASLKELRRIHSPGSNPDAIEYDPESDRVFVANHGSGDLSALDPKTGDVLGNIHFADAKLEGLGFDGRGQGFVNSENQSAVLVFDTHALKAKGSWPVAPGEGGTGLVVDGPHHRVFSACANHHFAVLDSDSGHLVATPEIGEDPDGLAFDAKQGLVFSPNPDGTLSIVHQVSADSYVAVATLNTSAGCRTIAIDEKTGRVFTAAPKFGPKPAPVKGGPRPKAPVLPGTFEVYVIGSK